MLPLWNDTLLVSRYGVGTPEVSSAPGWPVVLYFHHVHPNAERYTEVTPLQFTTAMDLMLEQFEPLDLEVIDSWMVTELTNRPKFVVTFDDGYLDTWHWAIPALDERGLRAIFFVVTAEVGQTTVSPRCMSWAQLAELAGRGHIIGSHTATHRDLSKLSIDEVTKDICRSFVSIQREIGTTTSLFAYPYGRIPTSLNGVLADVVGFGTVRAAALPWTEHRQNIRRTYFPAHRPELWKMLVKEWRRRWNGELVS